MAETILKGYLTNIHDYGNFDQIINFLAEDGNYYTMMALGTKKIMSKNARNLIVGSYNEFEFFKAREVQRVGKLKKTVMIEPFSWESSTLLSFNVLNDLINSMPFYNDEVYKLYKRSLDLVKTNTDEHFKTLIIMKEFLNILGCNLYVKNCVLCHNNQIKTISFKHHGLICNLCFKERIDKLYPLEISKLIYFLFSDQYEAIQVYESRYKYAIKLLKQYLFDNTGILIKSLEAF